MRANVMGVVVAAGVAWTVAAQEAPSGAGPAKAVQAEAALVDVSEMLHPIREVAGLPGMAVVVTRGRAVIAQGVSGVRKVGDETKVTNDDQWHLGSCTKSMTATLCAVLVEEGKLRWSSTIGEVFPDVAKDEKWAGVTLEQLLAHRAGVMANLPKDGEWWPVFMAGGTGRAQREGMVRDLLKNPPLHEPGAKFAYSNCGFALAGAMAEKVCDKAWEDLMREKVFGPLGMESAGFGAPGKGKEVDQPWGHRGGGSPSRGDNPPAIGPAGTVHCSLPDWAKYVALHTGGERAERGAGEWLLKPETFVKLHTPYDAPRSDYGFGWAVLKRPWGKGEGGTGRVLTHAGSNTMWYCVVWAAPELDMSVLVATNTAGDTAQKACDDVAGAMIKRFVKAAAEAEPKDNSEKKSE